MEKAEELELPAEVIVAIQISLQLMGNASAQNTIDRRKTILTQMDTQLKALVRDTDFKEAASLLFGENFATLAKTRGETRALALALALALAFSVFLTALGHKNGHNFAALYRTIFF